MIVIYFENKFFYLNSTFQPDFLVWKQQMTDTVYLEVVKFIKMKICFPKTSIKTHHLFIQLRSSDGNMSQNAERLQKVCEIHISDK
jgi:hypothetical protein